MNQLDELVARLCPDGVESRSLADVTVRGSNVRWTTTGDLQFQYIDLSSVDRLTGKIGDTTTIRANDAPSRAQQIIREGDVIFATTRPTQMRWAVIPAAFDGQIASSGYCVLRPLNSQIMTNFLAHNLGTDRFRRFVEEKQVPGNYPSIPDSRVREFQIPIPPLEVQQKVVAILDSFTNLEAELEAELEARRVQYRHYRDALLSFGQTDCLRAPHLQSDVEFRPIGELGELVRGNGMPKSDFSEAGVGCIHYGQIYTYYGTWTTKTKSFIPTEKTARLARVDPRDLIITNTSENIDDVCKAVAWLGDSQIVTGGHATVLKHDQDPKFLSYYMQTPQFFADKKRHATGTKVIDVSAKSLAKIRIPVPPLEEQERIVSILDKFDALVNDLSSGLPAEIAVRRRQYEHYRDRLLTFKQAA